MWGFVQVQGLLLLAHYFTPSLTLAVDLVPDGLPCLSPSFKYNRENAATSRYAEAYYEWNQEKIKSDPYNYTLSGAYYLFGIDHWNHGIFDCDLDNGCLQRFPSCKRIYKFMEEKKWKDSGHEEIVSKTRDAWFTMYAMSAMNDHAIIMNNLMIAIQENLTKRLAKIMIDFTPESDAIEMKCATKRAAEEAMALITMSVLSTGTGFVTSSREQLPYILAPYMKMAEVLATTGITHHFKEYDDHFRQYYGKYFEIDANRKRVIEEITQCSDKDESRDSSLQGFFRVMHSLEADFLKGKDRYDVSRLLNRKLERYTIEDSRYLLRADMNPVSFPDFMKTAFWPTQDPQIRQKLPLMEQKLTKAFVEETISSALIQSKCYVKCKEYPDAFRMCSWKYDETFRRTSTSLDKYRVCHNDGTVCQMQCYGNDKSEHKLHGLDKLLDYAINPTDIITNSLALWKKYHNEEIPGKFDPLEGSVSRGVPLLQLPVCFSDENVLVDFDKEEIFHNFPYVCGFFGSETRAVLDKLDVKTSKVGDVNQEEHKHTYQRQLLPAMANWSPVKRFVTLCELNIRWPYRQSHSMMINEGPDRRCPEVKAAIQGMTEFEANMWFCQHFSGLNDLKEEESKFIDDYKPFPVSHHERCIGFLNEVNEAKKQHASMFTDQRIQFKTPYGGNSSNEGKPQDYDVKKVVASSKLLESLLKTLDKTHMDSVIQKGNQVELLQDQVSSGPDVFMSPQGEVDKLGLLVEPKNDYYDEWVKSGLGGKVTGWL